MKVPSLPSPSNLLLGVSLVSSPLVEESKMSVASSCGDREPSPCRCRIPVVPGELNTWKPQAKKIRKLTS